MHAVDRCDARREGGDVGSGRGGACGAEDGVSGDFEVGASCCGGGWGA